MQSKETESWKEHTSGFSSVAVYISDELGRLLMVQDIDSGKWAPIAGYIDDKDFEEPEMAAIREAKEELGLDVTLDKLIGVWHYQEENGTPHIGYGYTATVDYGTFIPQANEIRDYRYFSPDEIEQLHKEGNLKTPQYNYKGYQLWRDKIFHPRSVIIANARRKEDWLSPLHATSPVRKVAFE